MVSRCWRRDLWDSRPTYTDILTAEQWAKLPKAEQKTYRAAEKDDGGKEYDGESKTEYSRPKKVYWRDESGRGIEDDNYSRRNAQKTRASYEDVLADHLAQHAPFAMRCYAAADCAPVFDADGLYALCVRQLMEPDDLLSRGYRWDGLLEDQASGQTKVLIPHGADAAIWGDGGKVYLYQFYPLAGEPGTSERTHGPARRVPGRRPGQTYLLEEDEQVPAITNLRETWGFSRLPCGYYYGAHLQTDDRDDMGVPYADPDRRRHRRLRGPTGRRQSTSRPRRRKDQGKIGVVPAENVPVAAYLVDSEDQLKPLDIDQDSDVVTLYGPDPEHRADRAQR